MTPDSSQRGIHDGRCAHSFSWTGNSTGPAQPPEFYISTCGFCGTQATWRDGAWMVGAESAGSWAIGRAERFGDALTEIAAVLGPGRHECPENGCEGCKWEMHEALRIVRRAVGLDA